MHVRSFLRKKIVQQVQQKEGGIFSEAAPKKQKQKHREEKELDDCLLS